MAAQPDCELQPQLEQGKDRKSSPEPHPESREGGQACVTLTVCHWCCWDTPSVGFSLPCRCAQDLSSTPAPTPAADLMC